MNNLKALTADKILEKGDKTFKIAWEPAQMP